MLNRWCHRKYLRTLIISSISFSFYVRGEMQKSSGWYRDGLLLIDFGQLFIGPT